MNKKELEKEVARLEYRLKVKINCENAEMDTKLRVMGRKYNKLLDKYVETVSKMVKYMK